MSEDHLADGIISFAMVFFAIWWVWLNFTWFGSAYDNDDLIHRLLTLLQIAGSLILAAGVARMFDGDFNLSVTGYVVMRIALVAHWLRVGAHDPARRTTSHRYALGIVLVQAGWVTILFVPPGWQMTWFLILVAAEFAVPVLAERSGMTPWHPHHIAERYGLFFIIVLGESVLAATIAIQEALDDRKAESAVMFVVTGGMLIVFCIWWLYFSRDAGDALARIHGRYSAEMFLFGFGHYFVYAAGAAIGAGLAARVDFWTNHGEASVLATAAMITGPVALLLVSMWGVAVRMHDPGPSTYVPFGVASVLVLAATFTPVPELLTGLVLVVLLVVELRTISSEPASDAVPG